MILKPQVPPGLYGYCDAGLNGRPYCDVEYRLSCAVFDKEGLLLGTASHVESVKYLRLGSMPTLIREMAFDFGASKAYERVAYATFSISEPAVQVPPDGGQLGHRH